MYVRAPVNSNIITTTVTVILMTPLPMYRSSSELSCQYSHGLKFPPQCCGCAKEGIRSRRYARDIRSTRSENSWVLICTEKWRQAESEMHSGGNTSLIHGLHYNPNHSAKSSSNGHRWHEDACGNFTAICDYNKSDADESGQKQRIRYTPLSRAPGHSHCQGKLCQEATAQIRASYWHKSKTLPPPSHSLKRMAMLAVISSRRKRLK